MAAWQLRSIKCTTRLLLCIPPRYEALVRCHPSIEDYKLYYAQSLHKVCTRIGNCALKLALNCNASAHCKCPAPWVKAAPQNRRAIAEPRSANAAHNHTHTHIRAGGAAC